MCALEEQTIEYLAEEADVRATEVADAWMKVQWRYIADSYRDLAQITVALATNAEQIENTGKPIDGRYDA
jgi:orotate phosphoribosyltransferase-like protein